MVNYWKRQSLQEKLSRKEAQRKSFFPKSKDNHKVLKFSYMSKSSCVHCGKKGLMREKCWKCFPHLCMKKNQGKRTLARGSKSTSATMGDVISRREGFFLMSFFNKIMYEDLETWFIDSVYSLHVSGIREIFLRITEIDSDCYVG